MSALGWRNIDLSQTTLLAQNEEGEQSVTAHTTATTTHWQGHLTHWQVHLESLTCSWSSHIRGAWWAASHPHQGYPILLLSRSRAQLSCYWTSCSSRTGKRRMLQVRNQWRTGPEWIQRWSTLTPWRRRRALPTWLGTRTRSVVPRGRTGDPWAVEKEPNLTLAPDNVCQCPLPCITLVTWERKTLPRYSTRAHTKILFLSNGDSAAQEACTHKKIFKH